MGRHGFTRLMRVGLAAGLLTGSATAMASPRIGTPMSDHAVLQRDRPIVLTGTADPGERLTVTLGPRSARVTADRQGNWRAELRPMGAGGPYRLEVKGRTETATVNDLLIGDVWLCSGQSNMEYPVKEALNGAMLVRTAADPQVRLLSMAHRVAFSSATPLDERPGWAAATPETAANFSAACFLMVKRLRTIHADVPMGAIDSSWGGTQIRPWIASQDARELPGMAEDAALLELYQRDKNAAVRGFADRWGVWWRKLSGDAAGQEPWNAPDRRQWRAVPKISFWEEWGIPETADLNALIWFRNQFDLGEVTGDATLDLGGIDELDTVWVNGVPVGSTFGWGDPRSYKVPASALKKGRNEVMVAVADNYGPGGMKGPVEAIRVVPASGQPIPLGKGWRFSIATEPGASRVPRVPWESHSGLATLYNGMIAPLGPIGLKGVAWYQGESDADMPGYDMRMAALMKGWRRQFGDPTLPFMIVGLADYGSPASAPTESGWAVVRDEQRKAAVRDGHAAIVTTVDIGERTDIHPANKNELGARLARAASALAYGDKQSPSGPLPARVTRDGNDVVVAFQGVTGTLRAWSAPGPIGFELCGGGACRYALARIEGANVRLQGDGRPVDRVRYAWADAPVVNLFDEAPLPAVPFEMTVENADAR